MHDISWACVRTMYTGTDSGMERSAIAACGVCFPVNKMVINWNLLGQFRFAFILLIR